MTLDENNHLFCGHGEQMFTVILCLVKKKGLFHPTKTATFAWLNQNFGAWVLLYISWLQPYTLSKCEAEITDSNICRRALLTVIYYASA